MFAHSVTQNGISGIRILTVDEGEIKQYSEAMDSVTRVLLAVVVVSPIVAWSAVRVWRNPRVHTYMQATGAFGLLVVIAAHICEALRFFPQMGWGQPHSVGHYLDLSGAILGVMLVPLGYLLGRRTAS